MSLNNDLEIEVNEFEETQPLKNKSVLFKSWLDQYQLIHHLILYSNILMVFQGRKGSGKTTYIEGVKDKLPQEFLCESINARQLDNVDSLNLSIRQLFSLSSLTVENAYLDTPTLDNDLLSQIITRQKHSLLIIDDAHQLSDVVITSLLTLLQSQDQTVYFHCLLVGDPLLTSRLSQPPFIGCDESFTHAIEMPELEIQDARNFLNKKFSSLGTMQVSTLNDACVSELIVGANGDLDYLTELTKAKLSGTPIIRSSTAAKIPNYQRRGMATIAVVLCLTIVTFIRSPSSTVQKTQKLSLPMRHLSVENSSPEVRASNFKAVPALAPTIDLTENKIPASKSNKSKYVPMSMIPKYTLLSKKTIKTKETIAKADLDNALIHIEKKKGEKAPLTLPSATQGVHDKIKSRMDSAPIATLPLFIPAKALVKASAKPVVMKKKLIKRNNKKSPSLVEASYGKGYGIQLIAATNLNSLKRFARKYHVFKQAHYYTKRTKGKNWYMLVLGDYASRQQAIKAQSALPSSLKEKKLWIRSIKGLKQIN